MKIFDPPRKTYREKQKELSVLHGRRSAIFSTRPVRSEIDFIPNHLRANESERRDGSFEVTSIYRGNWEHGKRSGFGVEYRKDFVYIGRWKDHKRNGMGTIFVRSMPLEKLDHNILLDESWSKKYSGVFKDNKYHGDGILYGENREIVYEGEFKDGYKHGKGKSINEDGSFYEGEFLDGEMNGYGLMKYLNGSSYEGYFKNNYKHGKGIFIYQDGSKYAGFWDKDKPVKGEYERS